MNHLLDVAALAARQHGVVATAQVRALGLGRHQIHHLVGSGHWERLSPMVLRRRGSPATRSQDLVIAALDAGLGAAISHLPGAALWGTNLKPGAIEVTRERGTTSTPARFARIHEPRLFPPHHRTVLDGIPVTVPSRIPFDVAATAPSQCEKVLDRLWSRQLVSHRSMHTMLDELAERGRQGITLMRELLAERGPDYRPNDSNLEDRFQQLAREAGLTDLERQQQLLGREWLGRVDFLSRRRRLVIEVQSARYHDALVDRAADAARRRSIEAAGYRLEEFTDWQIWFDPATTVRRLRRLASGL